MPLNGVVGHVSMPAVHDASVELRGPIELREDLETVAVRLAHRYRQVRQEIDRSGTLFARHELQSALILVRRLRRYVDAAEAELQADLDGLGAGSPPPRHPGRPLRVVRSSNAD